MGMTMRVSLPGYDCLTDTNLDHFALHADADNVLIKEFTRGTAAIAAGGTLQIAHNLGYVPMFLTYVNYGLNQANARSLVPSFQDNGVSVPPQTATTDTGTVTIINNEGASRNFAYYIFYDNFTANVGTITPNTQTMRVSKQGVNALTSVDPNAYIFHSDLNTFKIVSEGTVGLSYTGGTAGQTLTFNHNAGLGTPTSYAVFMKFPDGYTTYLPGNGLVYSYDSNWNVHATSINNTQISLTAIGTGNATLYAKYYVFETPLLA